MFNVFVCSHRYKVDDDEGGGGALYSIVSKRTALVGTGLVLGPIRSGFSD